MNLPMLMNNVMISTFALLCLGMLSACGQSDSDPAGPDGSTGGPTGGQNCEKSLFPGGDGPTIIVRYAAGDRRWEGETSP